MQMNVRYPLWLSAAPKPGAKVFASLFLLESMARASVASVIPLQAYDLLKSEQAVSLLYTLVGIGGLIGTIFVPLLIRSLARRWIYALGGICLLATAFALATFTIPGQATGMMLRVFGSACLNIVLNLYIMDFIGKRELVNTESVKMTYATLAWTIGPFTGVWLYSEIGIWAAYGFSCFWVILLLGVFWWLRLSDNPYISPGNTKPSRPLRNIKRFVEQPRLRLAWMIAFGRSVYWATFFIYAPILMVASGEGKLVGGLLVSFGNVLLVTALLWGKLGNRFGVRRVAAAGFCLLAVVSVGAGLAAANAPLIAAVLLLSGCCFAVGLDAVGGVPFLRAVRSYERPQMTSVYRTYLDMSELVAPFVYGIVLGFFGFGAVFVTMAVFMMICAFYAWRWIPKSM